MKFDFFTFGGRFFWEDLFNYQGWVIQRHTRTKKYRLLDNHGIRRDSGSFTDCKNTLLKYIEAYELPAPYTDSVLLLHNFGRTKFSLNKICDSLKEMKANIIAVNSASLQKSLNYQANQLIQFIKNLNHHGKLYVITHGSGCLLLRKLLASADNYRAYHLARVIDINPINSGSDLADLLKDNIFCQKVFGPMLAEMAPQKAFSLAQLPKEIPHGLIFYPPTYTKIVKKLISRFESFPFASPPSEQSYADDRYQFSKYRWFPLADKELGDICRQYLLTGKFPAPAPKEDTSDSEK
ncbi:MAG: hypothetical protein Q4D80_06430 [Pseudomonadota bacterium]|nr:hypothetical protein [Pseudomonadota bacterium]